MKILAALTVILIGVLIGNTRATEIDQRREIVESLLADIRKISMQIEFTSEPIVIVLDKVAALSQQQQLWQDMIRYLNDSYSCKEAWQKTVEANNELGIILQSEEKRGLSTFFSSLGTGDKKSEKENAEYVYRLLDDINSRIKKDSINRIKLNKNLGLLVGIAVAILLI